MDTYSELVETVQELAEDTSTEFVAYIPTAIEMAEARLFRIVDIDFSTTATLTTSTSTRELAKPDDWRVTHNIYVLLNGERTRMWNKTEDFIYDYWPSDSESDEPKYFAEKDEDTWLFAPTPNGIYNVYVEYEAQPVNISASQEENIFTRKYPDLLLYATMSNICEWMKDDERKGIWEEKLAEALASTNNEGARTRHDDNTNVNNPIGGRNTKVKNGV